MDPTYLSAKRQAKLIRHGEIGCVELLDHYIARVERHDGKINAIVVRDFDRARKRAKELDRKHRHDGHGKLHGVPMTVKESFDVTGLPTTWGIPGLEKTRATSNALAVDRLLAAGAVVFGKTNVPIHLGDWQTFNAIYGTTNNPWNLTLGAGGSSGGAAAALAAGLTGLELGSDIGASIRNPAHYCGVYGHKPTFGICPPLGQTLAGNVTSPDIAVIGPMARSAEDLSLALNVIAGPEEIESGLRLKLPPPRYRTLKGMRIAIMTEHALCETDDEIQTGLGALASHLTREGAKVSLTARPDFDMVLGHQLYIMLLRATTSGRNDDAAMAHWAAEAARLPADDTGYYALMARGTAMVHRDYLRGHELRERMRRAWAVFFQDYDAFLCPAAAGTAMPHNPHGERWERRITVNGKDCAVTDQMFWAGLSCFFHLPGTVAPLGTSRAGLPFGVQIVGPQYGDRATIGLARLLEKSWQGFSPPPGWA